SDSDDSENNFGQQKEYSDESKTKNADINRNPPDDTDQNKGFKEHKSKTSAHNKKEDGKDNQTLADSVGNTGVDVEASKANKQDVSFESKKNYTNRKASSPSPKEDTRNDDNSEKTQAAAMQSGHQPKTQQKNEFSSSSDDSDREIDSSNQKNDRKYPDKTKSKSNENYQGLAENTGDTDGDLDPSKDSKNDNYKANDYDDASEN
uniref:Uncharacterized protein n=1 Tax=Panagrolaimus sp. PS1159 TaxID=55785 RepID=A0AC35GEM5_9BILA